MDLRVRVVTYVRPLGPPSPDLCDEHALRCALVQHFAVTVAVGDEDEEPVGIVTVKGHV